MVKIAWKVINGHGPYAYLQKSVKQPNGSVVSQHLAYLGGIGKKGMFPGKVFNVPPTDDGKFDGGRVLINPVPDELKAQLKPTALKALESIEEQVQSGVPTQDIVVPKKGKTGQLGATGLSADQAPPSMSRGELGATAGGSADWPKAPGPNPMSEGKKGNHDQPHVQKISAAAQTGQTNGGLAGAFSAVDAEVDHLKTLPGPDDVPAPAHQVNVKSYADALKQQLLSAELAGKIPPTAQPEDVKDLVRLAVQSGVISMETSAATLVAKSTTQDRKESIPVVAANIKLALQGKLGAGSGPYQSPSVPLMPLSYHAPASKVVHYEDLEKAAASGFAGGGIAGAVAGVQKRAQELQVGSSTGDLSAVNVARRRLLFRLIDAWITDEMEPNDLPALTRAPLTRTLASAATRGIPKFDEKVLALTTEPSDDQVKYVQSVAALIKTHLSDQLAHDVSWKPELTPGATVSVTGPAPELTAPPAPSAESPAVTPPLPSSPAPKLGAVPKAANGKPLISAINVKKLENIAVTGDVETLDLLVAQIDAKLLAPAKKQALQAAAVALKSQMGPAKSESTQSDSASSSPLTTPVSLPEVVAALESHHLNHPDYPLLQAQTLDAMKADGIAAGIASLRRGVGLLKKEALTSQWIELDNIGRWTTVHILTTAMKSPVGQILAPNVNVVHDLASTASLEGIVGLEAQAAALAESYPDAPAVAAQMKTLLPSDPPKAPKVTSVPTNSKGQPLVTQVEVQKLQNAATLGNIYHLNHTLEELSL